MLMVWGRIQDWSSGLRAFTLSDLFEIQVLATFSVPQERLTFGKGSRLEEYHGQRILFSTSGRAPESQNWGSFLPFDPGLVFFNGLCLLV